MKIPKFILTGLVLQIEESVIAVEKEEIYVKRLETQLKEAKLKLENLKLQSQELNSFIEGLDSQEEISLNLNKKEGSNIF